MGFVECKVYEYEKQEICMMEVHSSLKFSFVWADSLDQCMKQLINEPPVVEKKGEILKKDLSGIVTYLNVL